MKRHYRFVWNYGGHNAGLFERGPNWWQITFPWSRRLPRAALIVTQVEGAASDRA